MLWWLALRYDAPAAWTRIVLPARSRSPVAGLLWLCTAMIYACLRFIEEWAHPLTFVNFVFSGLVLGLRAGCRRWHRSPAKMHLCASSVRRRSS